MGGGATHLASRRILVRALELLQLAYARIRHCAVPLCVLINAPHHKKGADRTGARAGREGEDRLPGRAGM